MILKNICTVLIVLTAFAPAAHATKTVTSPYVTKGKTTVEWRGGYEVIDGDNNEWAMKNQISHGFTDFWDVKLSANVQHDEETNFTSLDWENKFQIAPKGTYFVDMGVRLDYSRALDGGADEVGGKFLFAKETGPVTNTLNLEWAREVGDRSEGEWSYGIAYGGAVDVGEDTAIGIEWYSDFGDFKDDFEQQEHLVGPVVYGAAFGMFKYQAGVLAGLTEESPDALFKSTVRYDF